MEKQEKENKKKKLGISIVIFIVIFAFTLVIPKTFGELFIERIIYGIGFGLIGFLLYFFGKENKNKEKENAKEFVKSLDTKSLKELIEDQEKFREIAEKEYVKRKDKSISEKIGNQFDNIIYGGVMVFFIGIIMFGGIGNLFGVNNEFTNPTNFTNVGILGNATNSIEVVGNACSYTIYTLMDIGKERPILWFCIFWAAVFIAFILPLIKIIYYTIKGMKGGFK